MAKAGSAGSTGVTKWTEPQARELLAAWEKSGQSGGAYARSVGVPAHRLFWWRRRLRERRAAGPAFLPIVAVGSKDEGAAGLVVTTAGGVRVEVRVVDAATAAWVSALLASEARS